MESIRVNQHEYQQVSNAEKHSYKYFSFCYNIFKGTKTLSVAILTVPMQKKIQFGHNLVGSIGQCRSKITLHLL